MSGRPLLNFFQVSSLVMLLVAVALLAAIATMHFAIHGAEVQVPALKGMTAPEARAHTAAQGLELSVDNRYYSADVGAGHILSQQPAPGTVVRRGWRVRVTESLGPQKADVPDTVGADERKAMLELRREGLNVGTVARLPYAGAEPGTVLAQDPPAHAVGIASPRVALLVAAAPSEGADGFLMPDLTGLSAGAAQLQLTQAGMKTVSVAKDSKPAPVASALKSGTVTGQTPAAGSRVEQSTAVRLTVAP